MTFGRAGRYSLAVLLTLVAISAGRAQAQNWPGMPPAFNNYARQAMQQQRAYEQQQAQAAARERAPHIESAPYSGQLGPVAGLRRLVAGKTLYLERPVVANHVIQKMEPEEIYLAANGVAHATAWSGPSWTVTEDAVCFGGGQQQRCLRALQDNAGQIFFAAPNGLLAHLVRTGNGDSANVVVRFERNQKQARANDQAMSALAGAMLGGLLNSGGGGGSSNDTQYRYMPGSSGGGSGSAPSYTPPIGGERGLYGSSHGVGN